MGTTTPNYALNKPTLKSGDLMSDFDTWLNNNWAALEGAAAPNSGTTLPTSGTYAVGDRFYKSDTKSIYILVCRDVNWGWFWRPIHDALSPWVTPPDTCMNIAGWDLDPVPAKPMQIALDNRGKIYWRGVIGTVAGTFARNISHQVFKPIPNGISPRESGSYMLGHDTLAVNTTATSLQSYQGARIFLPDGITPGQLPTIRGFGGTADFNRVHLGGIHYPAALGRYTTV